MKNENSPKEFILEFFKDSKITDKNGVLTIADVQKDFEDFIGKKSPYKLVFDIKMHDKVNNSELIMQGSYFLTAIRDYLSNKGQTSLLKISFDQKSINLGKLKLKNSEIIEIKVATFSFLSKFSFLSIYQYLNEKKQSINEVLIKDKQELDLDLNKLKIITGSNEEIKDLELDLNKDYVSAKNKLNSLIAKEIKSIKPLLKEKLEKELARVKDHYFKQIEEKDEELERIEEKIRLLKSKLKHTYYDRDISILNRIIRESKERLENLKEKSYKTRLKVEEKFHINDEIEKHALSIKNGLINISLIYYPVYNLLINSRGKKSSVRYDPLLNKLV